MAAISANDWLIEALGYHHTVDKYTVNLQRSVVCAAEQIGSSVTHAANHSFLMMISYG